MRHFFPEKIYVLESPQNNTYVALRKNNKPYVVGFSRKSCARRVAKHVSDVEIFTYDDCNETISLGRMCINKTNLPSHCNIKEMSINCFMDIPIKQNIGIVLGCEITADTANEFKLSSVVVDPMDDIEACRASMTI